MMITARTNAAFKRDLHRPDKDLIKIFDSVDLQAAWRMLSRYDCLNIYIRILMLLHDGVSQSAAAALSPPCFPSPLLRNAAPLVKSYQRGSQSCTEPTALRFKFKSKWQPHHQSIMPSQHILDDFTKTYRALGLDLNTKKTQVLHQLPPNQPITEDNTTVENVHHFLYLPSFFRSRHQL